MIKHRGYFSREERNMRSQLAKIVHRKSFLQGSLVKRASKCGKDSCWCAKADQGHVSCYLSIRVGSKRKMIYIPQSYEKQVRQWVKTYKEINKSIAKVSSHCLSRIKKD